MEKYLLEKPKRDILRLRYSKLPFTIVTIANIAGCTPGRCGDITKSSHKELDTQKHTDCAVEMAKAYGRFGMQDKSGRSDVKRRSDILASTIHDMKKLAEHHAF